ATPSDTAVHANLEALSQAGCRIDLDDFRGSNACIASLRRFPVDRVKIDRSLVQRVDQNAGEETLVTGVLAMAKGLGLKVLAEGAETSGELTKIAEMGFDHVQGFSVAAPMPLDATTDWIRENSENWMPYARIDLDKPVSRRVSPESTGKTA
ncbi:MAG: EAL domain-containing protein, partial [Paracoccaceae bacterium]|nr:EAL domain-containing protein [Paracoccaceae bacterium]